MNEEMNAPLPPEPEGVSGWFATWIQAVTRPNEQTFATMAASPNAKMTTAFLWEFIGSLVNFFVVSLVQGAVMGSMMQQFGLDAPTRSGLGLSFISVICGAPVAAIVSVVFFAMFTGVVQWVAKMFGGRGTFEQLAYVFAAITVPFTLVSSVLTLLSAIPFVGLCFGFLSIAVGIYVVVLEVMAVKGVNGFGWGQAAGSFFLPGIVLFCCIAVVVAGLMSVLAPAIRDTFNQLNQGF